MDFIDPFDNVHEHCDVSGFEPVLGGELADKAAIKTYLDSYTSDWKDTDAEDNEVDFDQDAAATLLWAKKIS